MQLDRIMEEEGFTDVEKALVKSPLLKNSERVKIITDIKIARSNNLYSDRMQDLTYMLFIMTVINTYSQLQTENHVLTYISAAIVVLTVGLYLNDYSLIQIVVKFFTFLFQRSKRALKSER